MTPTRPALLYKFIVCASILLFTSSMQAQYAYMAPDIISRNYDTKVMDLSASTNDGPIIFKDQGSGTLTRGIAEIYIDPQIAKALYGKRIEDMVTVSIQMEGKSNGIYVSKKNKNTFVLTELNNGVSNAKFSYKVIVQSSE